MKGKSRKDIILIIPHLKMSVNKMSGVFCRIFLIFTYRKHTVHALLISCKMFEKSVSLLSNLPKITLWKILKTKEKKHVGLFAGQLSFAQ